MKVLSGWLLDVYAERAGMVLWLLEDGGRRLRLCDPFRPTFYLAGPAPEIAAALRTLQRHRLALSVGRVERRELDDPDPIPVLEIAVHEPVRFPTLVRTLIRQFGRLRFYHADVDLPQRYFYERGLFPLARCEADVTADGVVRSIHATDSPWDTDYVMPPLSILDLSLEGDPLNPNHGSVHRLVIRVDGDERCLEMDDGADLVDRLNALLRRHDPDVLLTDWGDSYLLPRLLALARRLNLPLELNRDTDRPVGARPPRSYFSYGRMHAHAGARLLYGRLHLDRENSFMLGETGLAGLIEQARVTKVPIQQMARTTTGTGITSMQLETACRDGILIPYRKREPEEFKSAMELLRTDQGGLVFAPIPGYHENVAELDFASMYPTIMTRFNVSPETVNCRCCAHDPRARVPEIGHHTCRRCDGLVPRTLRLLLDKRAQYKRQLATTGDPGTRLTLDQRQKALKWLLVVSFGYLGYKNARFGRIEAHESVTAYSREVLLQAKETAELGGFRMLHAIVDALWVHKPSATRAEYEALAGVITERTGLPIVLEGVYHWIGFLPSRVNPRMPVPNQFLGLFDDGKTKIRGLEVRRSDAPPIVKDAQTEVIRCLAQARTVAELHARLPAALEIVRGYRQRLRDGHARFDELRIAKSLSKEPQAYRHATMTATAAKELAGCGVVLQPGETIHYIITDTKAALPTDRVRAAVAIQATGDGTWGYDAAAYEDLLLKAVLALLAPLGLDAARLRELTGPRRPVGGKTCPRN